MPSVCFAYMTTEFLLSLNSINVFHGTGCSASISSPYSNSLHVIQPGWVSDVQHDLNCTQTHSSFISVRCGCWLCYKVELGALSLVTSPQVTFNGVCPNCSLRLTEKKKTGYRKVHINFKGVTHWRVQYWLSRQAHIYCISAFKQGSNATKIVSMFCAKVCVRPN